MERLLAITLAGLAVLAAIKFASENPMLAGALVVPVLAGVIGFFWYSRKRHAIDRLYTLAASRKDDPELSRSYRLFAQELEGEFDTHRIDQLLRDPDLESLSKLHEELEGHVEHYRRTTGKTLEGRIAQARQRIGAALEELEAPIRASMSERLAREAAMRARGEADATLAELVLKLPKSARALSGGEDDHLIVHQISSALTGLTNDMLAHASPAPREELEPALAFLKAKLESLVEAGDPVHAQLASRIRMLAAAKTTAVSEEATEASPATPPATA